MEEEILARVNAVSDPTAVGDPEYARGLRIAVASAVRYGIHGVESGKGSSIPVPVELLAQVRSAAQNRVPLDTILRRYFAGHTLLSDFIVQEAKTLRLIGTAELQRLVRLQAELFDRLVEVIAAEYQAGIESEVRSPHQGRIECVAKLLAGQLVDSSELGYELAGWHVGMALAGAGVEQALRDHARLHDRRSLLVPGPGEISWAWLGGSRKPGPEELERLASLPWPSGSHSAMGEPAEGLAGWRLTHRQALIALPVAHRGEQAHVRYADVALLASALQDDVLATSLRHLYLEPLGAERDSAMALLQTSRAYFAAQRNSASAAAALGVTRQTVNNRLRVIEERLERPLDSCAADLELALRLQELEDRAALGTEDAA
jgi:hypothetical protein